MNEGAPTPGFETVEQETAEALPTPEAAVEADIEAAAEIADERMAAADVMVDGWVNDGEAELQHLEESAGLGASELERVRQESGVIEHLRGLNDRAWLLDEAFKQRTLGRYWQERAEGSPLAPGETFRPEAELKNVLRRRGEERRERYLAFKEKLAFQKEGLAAIQEKVAEAIRARPDASLGQLYEVVRDFAPRFGLTLDQKEVARQMLLAYRGKHIAVSHTRRKYQDDQELYRVLFGKPPIGQVEVIEGPMTLYVRCHAVEDYARIHSQSFLQGRDPEQKDILATSQSGGVSINTSLVPGLEGTIIAENAQGRPFDQEARAILTHEEQHVIKKLFRESELDSDRVHRVIESLVRAPDGPSRRLAVRGYLRLIREVGEARAKDEMLAYFKDRRLAPNEILGILITPAAEGGVYDYYSEAERQDTIAHLKVLVGVESAGLIAEETERVLKTEYERVLARGAASLVILEGNGYSRDQATALLTTEPLRKWGKITKRLVAMKQMREQKQPATH